jgi:hypothetical protein
MRELVAKAKLVRVLHDEQGVLVVVPFAPVVLVARAHPES